MSAILAILLVLQTCQADDARFNLPTPYKSTVDFVPVTANGITGYYVVYSPRKGYDYNVTMSIIPEGPNKVILFGTGYGRCLAN